jgi:uncharacterized protein DUF3828
MQFRHAAATLLILVSLLSFGAGASAEGRKASSAKYTGSEPASAGQTAEGFLHSIYDRYIGPQDKARPIDYGSTRELRHYFEPTLATIIHKDFIRAKKADDVPTLDADPFIDAQDWDIKSFDIHVTSVDASHATGLIKFDNAGTAKVLQVQLVRIEGSWKIHDIDYGGGEGTLRGLFKAAGSAN